MQNFLFTINFQIGSPYNNKKTLPSALILDTGIRRSREGCSEFSVDRTINVMQHAALHRTAHDSYSLLLQPMESSPSSSSSA